MKAALHLMPGWLPKEMAEFKLRLGLSEAQLLELPQLINLMYPGEPSHLVKRVHIVHDSLPEHLLYQLTRKGTHTAVSLKMAVREECGALRGFSGTVSIRKWFNPRQYLFTLPRAFQVPHSSCR